MITITVGTKLRPRPRQAAMVIVIMGSCVFRVIWVYTIFAHFHTIPSLYLLYIFSWTITAAAEILYFIRCCRRLRTAQTA